MKKKKKNSNQKISKKPERLRWLKVETEHQNMLRQFSVLNN
jgi:ribosomal protein L24E